MNVYSTYVSDVKVKLEGGEGNEGESMTHKWDMCIASLGMHVVL